MLKTNLTMNLYKHLIWVVATLLFVGCADKPTPNQPPHNRPGRVTIDILTQSNGDVVWLSDDAIILFENIDTYAMSECAQIDDAGNVRFTATVDSDTLAPSFTYDAIYPADRVVVEDDVTAERVKVMLPVEQHPTATSHDRSCDLLIADSAGLQSQPSQLVMTFERVAAQGVINLLNGADDELVKSVDIVVVGDEDSRIAMTGCNRINCTSGEVIYGYNNVSARVSLIYDTLVSITTPLRFVCNPIALDGGESVEVSIETNKTTYTAHLEQPALVFKAGEQTSIDIDLATASTSSREPWLELPAERTDGHYPNAREYVVMSSGERNYTHYYDVDTYTTLWVAYPIEAKHMGSYGRPSGWSFNPLIPEEDQVNLCSRSYSGNYSRGHLIPNASRNGIRDMQLQTFYVTNSVPQVQGGFNGGIWQNLESAIQDIGEHETVYVVTGVAFTKMDEQRSVSYTTAKDDNKQIPVPNYFYKVVLKVDTNDSGDVVDASTVGFWFENKSYSDSYTDHVVSVDQVEEWTGFDFFVNLPNGVESRVESNTSWSSFSAF